jgi:1,4-alpha-glucan branching enzyme
MNMIYKSQSTVPGHVRVVFELPSCIWADKIFVTGDFNNWDKNSVPMRQTRNGLWRVALDFPAGERYEFRYIIDGHWQTDYHADGSATNTYGEENSVVVAELAPTRITSGKESSMVREQQTVKEIRIPDAPVMHSMSSVAV